MRASIGVCEPHLQLYVGASEVVASWCFRAPCLFVGLGVTLDLTMQDNLLLFGSSVNEPTCTGWKDGLFNDPIDLKGPGQEFMVSHCSLSVLPQVGQKSHTGGDSKQVFLASQLGDLRHSHSIKEDTLACPVRWHMKPSLCVIRQLPIIVSYLSGVCSH